MPSASGVGWHDMIEGMQEGDLHVHVVDHRFRVLHRAANGHRWPVVVTVGPARQISQIQVK